jgi:hypothetical protein
MCFITDRSHEFPLLSIVQRELSYFALMSPTFHSTMLSRSQPEPARASQSQPEPARASQSHPEPPRATQSQPEAARATQSHPEPASRRPMGSWGYRTHLCISWSCRRPMGSRGYRTHFCSDISLFYVFDAPLQITYFIVIPWICQTCFRTTHRRHHCNTQHLSSPPFWHQRCAINRTKHLTELHSHDSIAWNNICYHIHSQHHGDQIRGTIANEISHISCASLGTLTYIWPCMLSFSSDSVL